MKSGYYQAVIVDASKENNLVLSEFQIPTPSAKEILIKVSASGINRADVEQSLGKYAPPEGVTSILGLEVAGTVEKVGEGVSEFKVGDRVMALLQGGGYAEYCVAPVQTTLLIPENLSFIEAAATPEALFTIWSNIFLIGKLKRGETFLIHGGTSGIGTFAIQIAKAFGANVIVTAKSAEKCQTCLKLGADVAINYREQDFSQAVLDATGGKGVDLILDLVGADYLKKNITLLKRNGRLVLIASITGKWGEIDLGTLIVKNLTLTGSVLRARPLAEKEEMARDIRVQLIPLLISGKVKPVIYQTFPLGDVAKAHAVMVSNQHIGKIVLVG